jgi:SAM-dependent methyltransferase
MENGVGREPQYDIFADEFFDHAKDGFYNARYDRPACLALLGDVAGKRVLDAACGPGLYAEELVRRGARVIGFDHSPRMVEICRARVGQAEFRVHDLGDPIGWLPDGCVDLAVCALAIEYVDDRVAALSELRRVLRRRRAGAVAPASHRGLAAPWRQLFRRPDHRGDLVRTLAGAVLAGAAGNNVRGNLRRGVRYRAPAGTASCATSCCHRPSEVPAADARA